jgi:hypothetical protein
VPSGKNVLWKTPIPGLAHSSPVVWSGKVFVTTAVRKEKEAELGSLFGSENYGACDSVVDEGVHRFELWCLDAASGKVLWTSIAHEGPPAVKRHPKSTHANSTPAAPPHARPSARHQPTSCVTAPAGALRGTPERGRLRWSCAWTSYPQRPVACQRRSAPSPGKP